MDSLVIDPKMILDHRGENSMELENNRGLAEVEHIDSRCLCPKCEWSDLQILRQFCTHLVRMQQPHIVGRGRQRREHLDACGLHPNFEWFVYRTPRRFWIHQVKMRRNEQNPRGFLQRWEASQRQYLYPKLEWLHHDRRR